MSAPNSVEFEEAVKVELRYINSTPPLLSLLYDMDLMPEQLERGSFDWRRMLIISQWHRQLDTYEQRYRELFFAVKQEHEGENAHQTIL